MEMEGKGRQRKGKRGPALPHRYPTRFSLRVSASPPPQVSLENNINTKDSRRFRACTKRSRHTSSIVALPREMILNILFLLPIQFVYEVMRCVCKEWYDIIKDPNFARSHLELSSPTGILVQDPAKPRLVFCLWPAAAAGLKKTRFRIPFPAKLLGSCNGLVLLHDRINPQLLHVMNLVTKVKVSLPPVAGLTTHNVCYTALAFSSSSGRYKVVHVSGTYDTPVKVMVCTVDVDKTWRLIDLGCIFMTVNVKAALLCSPHSTAGVIYWLHYVDCFGFALDVDTETMYQFPAPKDYAHDCRSRYVISMDTGVGLMHCRDGGMWDIWELLDFKSGIWGKVTDINSDNLIRRLRELLHPRILNGYVPFLLSVKKGELCLFAHVDNKCVEICYNVRKKKIFIFPIQGNDTTVIPYLHLNTLLSPKN